MIERNPILQQSISRRTVKYRQYLMDTIKLSFRWGEFKLSLKIHGNRKKKRTEMFEVVKGCEFEEVRFDLNISHSLSKLFEAAQNLKGKQYISAAPENIRRNFFDSILIGKSADSSTMEVVTMSWSTEELFHRILVEKDAAIPD